VRGEQEPESYLEIPVEFKKLQVFEYIQHEGCLSGILGVKADLVMKSTLKPAIGKASLMKCGSMNISFANHLLLPDQFLLFFLSCRA